MVSSIRTVLDAIRTLHPRLWLGGVLAPALIVASLMAAPAASVEAASSGCKSKGNGKHSSSYSYPSVTNPDTGYIVVTDPACALPIITPVVE